MVGHTRIGSFKTHNGVEQPISLSFQTFGRALHTAPVVLVNHALTGNSQVAGPNGWWQELIGPGKCIDTNKFTVLAFNIPGNGYDGFIIQNYSDFVAQDIARIFIKGLEELEVNKLFAVIGGSVGGGIAWEMAALQPDLIEHLIPIASDWKSTDWLIANCRVQEQILSNSVNPVHDARMHAMLCYRTPESLKERFERSINENLAMYNVESWLLHHGNKLQQRFQLAAYRLNNQLLKTIDITRSGPENFERLKKSDTRIHIIGVNSDLFFTIAENLDTFELLESAGSHVTFGEIDSPHGHDAFLIEFEQLEYLLAPIFSYQIHKREFPISKGA